MCYTYGAAGSTLNLQKSFGIILFGSTLISQAMENWILFTYL